MGAIQFAFIAVGLRHFLFSGRALPFLDGGNLMKVLWADVESNAASKLSCQLCGMNLATLAMAKVVMCWLPQEGQFLRYYLFLLFGLADCGCIMIASAVAPMLREQYDVDIMLFVYLWSIEVAIFLLYAVTKDRQLK